jgi:Family of unknown function (DUF6300)
VLRKPVLRKPVLRELVLRESAEMTVPRTPSAGRPDEPDITLTRTARRAVCPRCRGEGLLSASVPGKDEPAVLCPACDMGDAAAAPLIVFFIVHGRVTAEVAEEFAGLLRTWTQSLV